LDGVAPIHTQIEHAPTIANSSSTKAFHIETLQTALKSTMETRPIVTVLMLKLRNGLAKHQANKPD